MELIDSITLMTNVKQGDWLMSNRHQWLVNRINSKNVLESYIFLLIPTLQVLKQHNNFFKNRIKIKKKINKYIYYYFKLTIHLVKYYIFLAFRMDYKKR